MSSPRKAEPGGRHPLPKKTPAVAGPFEGGSFKAFRSRSSLSLNSNYFFVLHNPRNHAPQASRKSQVPGPGQAKPGVVPSLPRSIGTSTNPATLRYDARIRLSRLRLAPLTHALARDDVIGAGALGGFANIYHDGETGCERCGEKQWEREWEYC